MPEGADEVRLYKSKGLWPTLSVQELTSRRDEIASDDIAFASKWSRNDLRSLVAYLIGVQERSKLSYLGRFENLRFSLENKNISSGSF